jgi:hypothetical protein
MALGLAPLVRVRAAVPVDLAGYKPDCGVAVEAAGDRIEARWPMADGVNGRLVLNLGPRTPLIESIGVRWDYEPAATPVLTGVDPVTFLTVGTRAATPGRPPGMSPFNEFFDSPAQRPHETFKARLDLKRARVTSAGRRATIALGDLTAGPFRGELRVTLYVGSRLLHVEAVVRTDEPDRAILYDAGLAGPREVVKRLVWSNTEGEPHDLSSYPPIEDRSIAVRHRTIVADTGSGSLACFPPPHQFFFPRDRTDNLKFVWAGRNHRKLERRFGFGIGQHEEGGGSYSPWYNAPPGTDQHLGVFYLLLRGSAEDAFREVNRFTHRDRFVDLPNYVTLSSHWHEALAVQLLKAREEGRDLPPPEFIGMFKTMNVEIVHLAEFHGDGHPRDPGPVRLQELSAMFDVCRRFSDDQLLLLPGEEANADLGPLPEGRPTGHWVYLFPKPVRWIMGRRPDQPFVEEDADGPVYRVGGPDDMLKLLEKEHGLAWTSHPRIKASSWAPDAYRREAIFRSDRWLGAAWKAMPADLSQGGLGTRALDLLDDMANWGERKYLLGEVDVFQLDHTHELYGHMNVNYIKLDGLPAFGNGWRPVLDALRGGRFFVTTGEVLIPSFTVGGVESGSTLRLAKATVSPVRAELRWTFPLREAVLVSGDGTNVHREPVDLSETTAFGRLEFERTADLAGRKWVRLEVWDVAGNGAFTQPIWIEPADGPPARRQATGATP